MKRAKIFILPLIIFAFLAAAFFLSLSNNSGGGKFARHLGEAEPPINLPLHGAFASFNGGDWKGHAHIVNFFASWCVGCRAEHEGMMRLAAQGIPVIGIAYKDKAAALEKYLSKNGNPYIMVARDDDGRAGIDWGITGVPETFIIDKTGIIRFHAAGPLTPGIVEAQLLPLWQAVGGAASEETAP